MQKYLRSPSHKCNTVFLCKKNLTRTAKLKLVSKKEENKNILRLGSSKTKI